MMEGECPREGDDGRSPSAREEPPPLSREEEKEEEESPPIFSRGESSTLRAKDVEFDVERDDTTFADEASIKVWSAYQRWRVTKIRLSSIPPKDQPSFIESVSGSVSSFLFGKD
mmetsp:Transcript_36644/g.117542  ORF Transcript_36644/g.117542 Transcript_36644/m.117542 type:complete len:114 (+) Transcript_36644:56-397(+)